MACLAPVLASEHEFLDHDSFVGCNAVFREYSAAEIQEAHQRNKRVHCGELSAAARLAVRHAVGLCPQLSTIRKKELLAIW